MSFSSKVKDELSRQLSPARHCQIAEIAAIISLCGKIIISEEDHYAIKIHTENVAVARKYFTLLKKTFNIVTDVSIRRNAYLNKNRTYTVTIREHEDALRVLHAAKLLDEHGEVGENLNVVQNVVIQQSCCRRAFIRGAFLASGSLSDPEKFYHFEIVCATEEKAKQLQGIIAAFDLEAKIVKRKRYYIVYIKEGSQIVDILNVMEAPVALMELENIRILKDMRNSVNRQVNCETANINGISCCEADRGYRIYQRYNRPGKPAGEFGRNCSRAGRKTGSNIKRAWGSSGPSCWKIRSKPPT